MLTIYHRTVKEPKLVVLETPRAGTWIHVENPSPEELTFLEGKLKLDSDLLRDATDFFEVPRFETEGGTAYFFTRFPTQTGDEVATAPIMFAVTKSVVVSFCKEHPVFLDRFIEGRAPFFTTQRTKLFLLLAGAINKHYERHLISIRREVRRNNINLRTIRNRDIVRLVAIENTLNDFASALVPTNAALRTILSGSHLQLYEKDMDIIEDIQLSNLQLVESSKSILKTIQNIRSSYTAIVTNNLNQIIKFLTSLTVILTVPTIVASLYGMNVQLPFMDSALVFLFIVVGIVLIMTMLAFLFVKKEWL